MNLTSRRIDTSRWRNEPTAIRGEREKRMVIRNVKTFQEKCLDVLGILKDQLDYEESEDYDAQHQTREQMQWVADHLASSQGAEAIEVSEEFIRFLQEF